MAKMVKVTLVRSLIGEKPKTRATARGLGLSRLHQTVEHPDGPAVRGMIDKVAHLVEVERKG
ncbi:MAG: 50S ribosomal protein L30 [Actinomycetota bacterium]|nr:50S ribosomal protein L30 [Actinomycetota bacterium]